MIHGLLLWGLIAQPGLQGESVLSFADALAADGDAFRAITEYRRFLHISEQDARRPAIRMRIGDLYLVHGRFLAAAKAYEAIVPQTADDGLAAEAAYLRAEALVRSGRHAEGEQALAALVATDTAGEYAPRIQLRRGFLGLARGDEAAARRHWAAVPPNTRWGKTAAAAVAALEGRAGEAKRETWIGGLLSAVLPGAGQVYGGSLADGLGSLLVNGVFAFATYESWREGNHTAAGVLGMFELGFYFGNIYGGVQGVRRFNALGVARWRHTFGQLEAPLEPLPRRDVATPLAKPGRRAP